MTTETCTIRQRGPAATACASSQTCNGLLSSGNTEATCGETLSAALTRAGAGRAQRAWVYAAGLACPAAAH